MNAFIGTNTMIAGRWNEGAMSTERCNGSCVSSRTETRRHMPIGTFTAVLHKEGDLYVADCPEVGTVSQGKTVDEAIANLKEATELYLEEFPAETSGRPLVDRKST